MIERACSAHRDLRKESSFLLKACAATWESERERQSDRQTEHHTRIKTARQRAGFTWIATKLLRS